MSEYSQTYSTAVAGSVDACFNVLVDFERYTDWSSPITKCRIVDRYPDGLARRVEFHLDAKVKTLRYVLEYEYDPPHGARWHLVEGDIAGVEGSYRFEPAGERTTATCSQSIDVGFWVPGFLRRTFEASALQQTVEEFRAAVEKTA